jgi:hypothetical protein
MPAVWKNYGSVRVDSMLPEGSRPQRAHCHSNATLSGSLASNHRSAASGSAKALM